MELVALLISAQTKSGYKEAGNRGKITTWFNKTLIYIHSIYTFSQRFLLPEHSEDEKECP